jgi:disulfide bond formation protein DsbB
VDPRDVANFFALVLLLGAAGVIIAAIIPTARTELARAAPIVVAAMAIGATLGSLYYSEIADYIPCTYCWYQRIAMYPMAVIVPLAIVLRDRSILRYSLALGSIGLAISMYHIQLQLFPEQSSNSCALTSPCTAKWVEAFGFMTIPQMAGTSFAIIVLVSIIGLRIPPRAADATIDEVLSEQSSAV